MREYSSKNGVFCKNKKYVAFRCQYNMWITMWKWWICLIKSFYSFPQEKS